MTTHIESTSTLGLYEIPPEEDANMIDLPFLTTDMMRNEEELEQKFGIYEFIYMLCIILIIISLDVGIYYSTPKCDDCDSSSSSDDSSNFPSTSPTTSINTTVPMASSFYCGSDLEEANLCQNSCYNDNENDLQECPLFQYCFAVTSCVSLN